MYGNKITCKSIKIALFKLVRNVMQKNINSIIQIAISLKVAKCNIFSENIKPNTRIPVIVKN